MDKKWRGRLIGAVAGAGALAAAWGAHEAKIHESIGSAVDREISEFSDEVSREVENLMHRNSPMPRNQF